MSPVAALPTGMNADQRTPETLSQKRTDFSEDRTILAMERTFASWFRTGFASVGIGLGFQALFVRMEPEWVPKAIATLFLLLGIFLFVSAEQRACRVLERLDAHEVTAFRNARLRLGSQLRAALPKATHRGRVHNRR